MNKLSKLFLFFLTMLSWSCGSINSATITTTSTDEATGVKTYITTYPFSAKKGLVRIKNSIRWKGGLYPGCLYPDDCQNITLTVERHSSNQVIVKAFLNKALVELLDEGEDKSNRRPWHKLHTPNNWYKENGFIWVPWFDDTIEDMKNLFKAKRWDTMRGDNRLQLTLNEPGHYHIIVPLDADVEVDFSEGDINYITPPWQARTHLSIESSTVNHGGDSGCSLPAEPKQSWTYYWGNQSDPLTKLITQKGHINVPNP